MLRRINGDVAYCDLQSNYGHDAFLVDVAEQTELVRGFLESTARVAEAAWTVPHLLADAAGF